MSKMRSNFSKSNELLEGQVSIYLDLIRGISAILVLIEHLGSRVFVGYGNVVTQSPLVKLLYLIHLFGGPAVIIFFVLSGLFISRSAIKAIYENKWSWKSYLINRLSRLYTVLVPALLLTFILDNLGANYFGSPNYTNFISFIGNLFFLQNIFVLPYGSNGPLWSLAYELWYYILFPLIFLPIVNLRNTLKIIYFSIAFIILLMVGIKISSYFLIWLFGTFTLLLPYFHLLKRKIVVPIALLLVCFAMTVRPLVATGRFFGYGPSDLFFADLLVGLTFGFLIYALLHRTAHITRNLQSKSWLKRPSKMLASFSFSLYLIHYPIINIVYYMAAKNGFKGLQPSLLSISLEILIVIVICIIAFLFSKITEARTAKVRTFITKSIFILKNGNKSRIKAKEQNVT